jgi:hypothetical protein
VPFWRRTLEFHMMRVPCLLILCLITVPAAVLAGPPDVEAIRDGMLEAAGGLEAFQQLGVLELAISEEETASDGTVRTKQLTAYVDARTLTNMRLELPGDVVVARNGSTSWATMGGQVDDRPQTPRMAVGTLNQRLFPLLLPFTLAMEDVELSEPRETTFEGEPVWRVAVTFPDGFFVAPSMSTTWHAHIRRSDFTLISAEFLPPPEVRQVRGEGVRYRFLKHITIGASVKLPVQVLLDGIDLNGAPTGHVRVTRERITVRGPFEPALFVHPIRLQAIEEDMQ